MDLEKPVHIPQWVWNKWTTAHPGKEIDVDSEEFLLWWQQVTAEMSALEEQYEESNIMSEIRT